MKQWKYCSCFMLNWLNLGTLPLCDGHWQAILGEWDIPLMWCASFWNDFSLIVLFVQSLITSAVAQSVKGYAKHLWVAASYLEPGRFIFLYLLLILEMLFGGMPTKVIDFEILKTIAAIISWNPFILVSIAWCPIPT